MAQILSAISSSSTAKRRTATPFEHNLQATSLCVAAMFVGAFALRYAFEALGLPIQSEESKLTAPLSPLLAALSMVTLFPLVEEIVFRGLLISWLQRFGFIAAATISTSMFAAIHLPNTAHGWLYYAMLGGLFCVVRYYTSSVLWCIAAHAAYNLVPAAFIVLFLMKW